MELCEYLADGRLSLESVGARPPPSGAGNEPASQAKGTGDVRRTDDKDSHFKVDNRDNVSTRRETFPGNETLSNDTKGLDLGVNLSEVDNEVPIMDRLSDRAKRKRRIDETMRTKQEHARNLTHESAAPAANRQDRVTRRGIRQRGGATDRLGKNTYHASSGKANTEGHRSLNHSVGNLDDSQEARQPGPNSRNISKIKQATHNLLLARMGRRGTEEQTRHQGAKSHQTGKKAPHLEEERKEGRKQRWRFLSRKAPPWAGK